MNRKDIEKGIISEFTPMVEKHGLKKIHEDYSDSNHIAQYSITENDIHYEFNVVFIKPNYIKYANTIAISNSEVSRIYKLLDPNYEYEDWHFFVFRLDNYLHSQNADGFFSSNKIDTYVDKVPFKKEKLGDLSMQLYNIYFRPFIEKVIPDTNSLEKIDRLINDIPELMDYDKDIRIRLYSKSLVDQVLAGIIIAKIQNRRDYQQLVKRYLHFAEEFKQGEVEEIDLMRKAIEKFESGEIVV